LLQRTRITGASPVNIRSDWTVRVRVVPKLFADHAAIKSDVKSPLN
jgi:hypothetical protein